MIDSLLRALRQPEYLHTLLNPVPIYGLGVGLIGLAVALFLRSRTAQISTLTIILISSATALPVYLLGRQAEARMEGIVDADGRKWLEVHEDRAEKVIYAFYALGALSAAALLAPTWWPRSATPLALGVFAVAVVALVLGGFVAHAGGRIRHREFRTGPLPEPALSDGSGQRGSRDR